MNNIFSSLKIRGAELRNRIAVSPMCQYSAENGFPTDWHLVHLGSRAAGGAGLIIQEATAVSPEARISPEDLGIWSDDYIEPYRKITDFIKSQKSVPGIQLAHAGRKASTYSPSKGSGEVKPADGGWQVYGPDGEAFSPNYPKPNEMTKTDIDKVVSDFAKAAKRSVKAGYEIIELHFAHGYLVHQFYSPLSNKRKDTFGGSFENRTRTAFEIVKAVRDVLTEDYPIIARISCTDWVEGGWTIEDSVKFSSQLKDAGIDMIDCSSGGNVMKAEIPLGPGYQVPFAERIKKETGILTGAVGLITSPEQADQIVRSGQAEVVLMGREFLRNPYWPQQAAKKLGFDIDIPHQYLRAK
ncbi:MAG: NADH:flavin oxidoreductase/NADH oxidase [Bacteroidetes bacterium]|nr:NADH:flavin oxidoreductase/NADH oxidase [Bacteroidota bacterium]